MIASSIKKIELTKARNLMPKEVFAPVNVFTAFNECSDINAYKHLESYFHSFHWNLYFVPLKYSTLTKRGSRYLSQGGGSHRKRTRLIIWYFDFRISMDVSLLQENSTFPVLTMRMSPHLEPFFFLIYDCILHKCCAISNQYHFTNPISTFLPKFQGGPDPRFPPLDPPMFNRYAKFQSLNPPIEGILIFFIVFKYTTYTLE